MFEMLTGQKFDTPGVIMDFIQNHIILDREHPLVKSNSILRKASAYPVKAVVPIFAYQDILSCANYEVPVAIPQKENGFILVWLPRQALLVHPDIGTNWRNLHAERLRLL